MSVRGLGFLMVFHLSTVGLVPVITPVTFLLFSLPPYLLCIVLQHLRSPGASSLP
ncbi:hypothetical protein NQZ68_028104, partial [Dissostichus eleginoides]